MKYNKNSFLVLGTITLGLVGSAFLLNSNIKDNILSLRANSYSGTYHYIKTDFSLGDSPYIPTTGTASTFGYSTYSLIEYDGVFVTDKGDDSEESTTLTGIGWNRDITTTFHLVDEGIIGFEDSTKECLKDFHRILGVKLKIDIQGDRSIILSSNTYYLFELGYYSNDSHTETIREYKVTPEYYYEDYSSIYYEFASEKLEPFFVDDVEYFGWDIYKVVLKEVSVEYSCKR